MDWLVVLWLLIAAVSVFIVWAVRRAEGYRGMPSMPSVRIPRQRSESGYEGKPVAGKRRADRP